MNFFHLWNITMSVIVIITTSDVVAIIALHSYTKQ